MTRLLVAIVLLYAVTVSADTTQSRDGDGNKIQGPSFGAIRSADIGTKGFKCFSTSSRMAWEVKVVATDSTTGTAEGFKLFYNRNESVVYPVSAAFFQWQNSPRTKTPTITSICLRGYSTATAKTAYGVFQ